MSALPARVDSVLPAQADQWEADALDAIGRVETPEQAENLLARIKLAEQAIRLAELGREREQRWGRVRLMGERRYGELLGPAMPAAEAGAVRGSNTSGSERFAQHQARVVAAVPEEDFTEYVDTAEHPTRAGLLRVADDKRDKMAVHYSSATDDWATPQNLFDVLDEEFRFVLDVCALDTSAKCKRYFTPETDGLAQDWHGTCWMNPPYGSEIGRWVEKAATSATSPGTTVVCLLPARVDTGWWWDHCRHAEIRFLRGRLKFGNADAGAPFPSAVVVFGHEPNVVWWEWR